MNDDIEVRLECVRIASELDQITEFGIASLSADETLVTAQKFYEWIKRSESKPNITPIRSN